MSMKLIIQFSENKDATSISYKLYNQSPREKYPTFSICFKENSFHWSHDFTIFKAYGLTSVQYERLLKGEKVIRYMYNSTSRLYNKVNAVIGNQSDNNLGQFHLQLSDILVSSEFATENSIDQMHYKKAEGKLPIQQPPFYIGYHTPERICFTRISNDSINTIRLYDKLSLNRSIVGPGVYNDSVISIVVHYPEQLLRSLETPTFTSTFSEYRTDLELEVSQGTLLIKRVGSNEPCNDQMSDHYDTFVQKEMSKHFHCMPPYWNQNLKDELKLGECRSPDRLGYVYNKIKEHKRMLSELDSPCLDRFDAVVYNQKPIKDEGISQIKIIYKDRYDEEILYSQDFGFESFWSGIGGFAGLFMGISIMQIPPLFGKLIFDELDISNIG